MAGITLEFLTEQLALADELGMGRKTMFEPQDLPGRYGRVVKAVDRVLSTMSCVGLLADGWAVWRHGYVGRITQDVDILLPADRLDEFLRVSGVSEFEILPAHEGVWPKLRHKDTDINPGQIP